MSKKEKNEIEREYFRNLGVNIIYTSEIVNNPENKSHTEQLVEFFDYLLEDKEERLLDRIYNELKPLQELNYVYGKYVGNAFNRLGIFCEDGIIDLSNVHSENNEYEKFKLLLWTYMANEQVPEGYLLDDSDLNKLKLIKNVLCKSSFKSVRRLIDGKDHNLSIITESSNKLNNLIYMFDYKQLNNLKSHNALKLGPDVPILYMQQAYICSILKDYLNAYNCLKNASKIYYKEKNYVWYFLSEFNRKYVGNICLNPFTVSSLSKNERAQLETEVNAINIDQILATIPDLGHNHNEFLSELGTFKISYSLFHNMYADAIKVNKEAKTAYTLFWGTATYKKLRSYVQDYNDYETSNYIILDRYNEVKYIFLLYIRSVLSSVMAKNIPYITSFKDTASIFSIKQENINDFDIYIMLRYFNHSDLSQLFKEYDIRIIPSTEGALEYLGKISDSIIASHNNISQNYFSMNIFWTYLEIISHIAITEYLIIKILKSLSEQINIMTLISNIESINRFICNLYKEEYYQNPDISKLITLVINNILDGLISAPGFNQHFINMIYNLTFICRQSKLTYDDDERISCVIKKCREDFCVYFYSNLGLKCQKLILEQFASWKPKSNIDDYCLYCDLVNSGIVQSDIDIEHQIIEWINSNKSCEKNDVSSANEIIPRQRNCSDVISMLTLLFINNKIKNVEDLQACVNQFGDPMSRWLLNIEKFDYNYFDCNWLAKCGTTLSRTISQNKIVNKNVLKAYKKQYKTESLTPEANEIIIDYFISVSDENK